MRKFTEQILKSLKNNPSQIKEIAETLNISTRTVNRTLVDLKALNKVYILSYERKPTGGFPNATFKLGKGIDADKPIPIPHNERHKKCYQKHIARRTLMRHYKRGKVNMFSQLMVTR